MESIPLSEKKNHQEDQQDLNRVFNIDLKYSLEPGICIS